MCCERDDVIQQKRQNNSFHYNSKGSPKGTTGSAMDDNASGHNCKEASTETGKNDAGEERVVDDVQCPVHPALPHMWKECHANAHGTYPWKKMKLSATENSKGNAQVHVATKATSNAHIAECNPMDVELASTATPDDVAIDDLSDGGLLLSIHADDVFVCANNISTAVAHHFDSSVSTQTFEKTVLDSDVFAFECSCCTVHTPVILTVELSHSGGSIPQYVIFSPHMVT